VPHHDAVPGLKMDPCFLVSVFTCLGRKICSCPRSHVRGCSIQILEKRHEQCPRRIYYGGHYELALEREPSKRHIPALSTIEQDNTPDNDSCDAPSWKRQRGEGTRRGEPNMLNQMNFALMISIWNFSWGCGGEISKATG